MMNDYHRILFEKYRADLEGFSESSIQYEGGQCSRYQAIIGNAIRHLSHKELLSESEEICLAINERYNKPPLPESEVRNLVRLVTNPRSITPSDITEIKFDLNNGLINYSEKSPVRPFLFGNDVIPIGTLSVIGGLGGSGKSMAVIEMMASAASGKKYANRQPSEKTGSIYLAFEDSKEELNARFSAVMATYSETEKELIKNNCRAISLIGTSFQLVTMNGRNAEPTGNSNVLIEKLHELKNLTKINQFMLIIDHARLLASIDWNDAAQVTVLTQELHKIAHETKAAVILVAHSPKNTAAKDHETSQADIAGSTALVDNARYVALIRGMSPNEAKELGIKAEARSNYLKLECVKSNYSKNGLISWFIKTSCPNHQVATHIYAEPCKTITTKEGDSADESKVIKYIRANPDLTLTDLRKRAGKNGVLGMSDLKVRDIVNTLLEKGLLAHIPPTANYAKKTTPQFKGVLGVPSHV